MFEKIKKNWSKRTERNAFKSVLVHANKEGIKLMKEGIAFDDLPVKTKIREDVYFKRSLLPLGDWARIYPPISENGRRINLVNLIFGGRRNLIKLLIVLGIIALVFLQFKSNFTTIASYKELAEMCNATMNMKF